jgi:hypothetical protein
MNPRDIDLSGLAIATRSRNKRETPESLQAFRPRERNAIAQKEERLNSLQAFRSDGPVSGWSLGKR